MWKQDIIPFLTCWCPWFVHKEKFNLKNCQIYLSTFFRLNQVQLNRLQEFSTPREWKFQRVGGKMTVGGRWRVGGLRTAGSWRDLRFQGCCLRLLLSLQWLCHPRYWSLFQFPPYKEVSRQLSSSFSLSAVFYFLFKIRWILIRCYQFIYSFPPIHFTDIFHKSCFSQIL